MAAQNNFDAVLQADMDGLIAAAEPDPQWRGDAGRPLSQSANSIASIPAFITRSRRATAAGRSRVRCSTGKSIRSISRENGPLTWGNAVGPENQQLRVVSRRVDLTPDHSSDADYTFLVAGDLSEVERQTQEFNSTLFWSFLLLGLGLIAAILVQVKVGLLPLRQVGKSSGKNPRRRGAPAGRTFPHRDRAAGDGIEFA